MDKKYTAETLMVQPINTDKLKQYLSPFYNLKENQNLSVPNIGIAKKENNFIFTGKDCCFGYMEKRWDTTINKQNLFLDVSIQLETKNGNVTEFSHIDHYHPITLTTLIEQEILDPECSLKEFMGSRYNYNPRITRNANLLLQEINED